MIELFKPLFMHKMMKLELAIILVIVFTIVHICSVCYFGQMHSFLGSYVTSVGWERTNLFSECHFGFLWTSDNRIRVG